MDDIVQRRSGGFLCDAAVLLSSAVFGSTVEISCNVLCLSNDKNVKLTLIRTMTSAHPLNVFPSFICGRS